MSKAAPSIILIGLGRMGAAMAAHLVEQGITVHGVDPSEEARTAAAADGVTTYTTAPEALAAISSPCTVWLMVPSGLVDTVLETITPHLTAGDTVIDGGNSFFKDSQRRHVALREQGIEFLDCGVSGGIDGARHGASLMIGGPDEVVEEFTWLLDALAIEDGFAHVGGPGAGHYVKMVHNAIEYGMMGAIAEGIHRLEEQRDALDLDVVAAFDPYEHGSIIESSLVRWLAEAYRRPGYLESIAGEVPRGETEPEMEYLLTEHETPILAAALAQRVTTRTTPSRVGTLIAAMRNEFGGHATKPKDTP